MADRRLDCLACHVRSRFSDNRDVFRRPLAMRHDVLSHAAAIAFAANQQAPRRIAGPARDRRAQP